jgi:hypothetical protein
MMDSYVEEGQTKNQKRLWMKHREIHDGIIVSEVRDATHEAMWSGNI